MRYLALANNLLTIFLYVVYQEGTLKKLRRSANQLSRNNHCMISYNNRENVCVAVCDSREEKNCGWQRPKKPLGRCQEVIPDADIKHVE
jgi:hypothetical protein